jgi:hypothetical protein
MASQLFRSPLVLSCSFHVGVGHFTSTLDVQSNQRVKTEKSFKKMAKIRQDISMAGRSGYGAGANLPVALK